MLCFFWFTLFTNKNHMVLRFSRCDRVVPCALQWYISSCMVLFDAFFHRLCLLPLAYLDGRQVPVRVDRGYSLCPPLYITLRGVLSLALIGVCNAEDFARRSEFYFGFYFPSLTFYPDRAVLPSSVPVGKVDRDNTAVETSAVTMLPLLLPLLLVHRLICPLVVPFPASQLSLSDAVAGFHDNIARSRGVALWSSCFSTDMAAVTLVRMHGVEVGPSCSLEEVRYLILRLY